MALTYHNNNSISNVTSFAQVPSGSPVLLSTATASGSSSISFTSGIDSTYDVYQFEFINMHPQNLNVDFQFNLSTDGGSNYNVTKTSTSFRVGHREDDGGTLFNYDGGNDLAQSTAYQKLIGTNMNNDNDMSVSGYLQIFNPSSTTFVKHYIATNNYPTSDASPYVIALYVAGYGNTTSAINAIRFQMSSGNIDDGTIKMYGIK